MGTTASAIVINDRLAVIAHVGDSRIYRLRGDQFKQLTTDHSWVQEQVQAGELTPSAARQHPRRNIVTRSLSGGEDPDVDLDEYELEIGDRFLICSDGLFAVVSDERIKELLSQSVTLETVCNNLVETANAGGGPDNITTLVLQIDDP
jgi:protein phosphatase